MSGGILEWLVVLGGVCWCLGLSGGCLIGYTDKHTPRHHRQSQTMQHTTFNIPLVLYISMEVCYANNRISIALCLQWLYRTHIHAYLQNQWTVKGGVLYCLGFPMVSESVCVCVANQTTTRQSQTPADTTKHHQPFQDTTRHWHAPQDATRQIQTLPDTTYNPRQYNTPSLTLHWFCT